MHSSEVLKKEENNNKKVLLWFQGATQFYLHRQSIFYMTKMQILYDK